MGLIDILHRLHPTPAVGGMPPGLSRALIQRLEPFGRGWFGAPVGWMTKDAAEFAVGIRSALVRGNELHLFGGAGIVIGSDAGMEWQETVHKMENFARILRGC
jgi:menaquinone-specific isochorismate synthase